MKSRSGRAILLLLLPVIAAYGLDLLVWTIRGFPTRQIPIEVIQVMELKGQKEDYGDPETIMQSCRQSLFPSGTTLPCWWLTRHREIIRRD